MGIKKLFRQKSFVLILTLLLALCLFSESSAAPQTQRSNLNKATVTLVGMDIENKSMDIITMTAYDPKTNEGTSRYTIYWDKNTTFQYKSPERNLSSIKKPIAAICSLDPKMLEAAKAGKPFTSYYVQLLPKNTKVDGFKENQFSGIFTPDTKDKRHLSGFVDISGKKVRCTIKAKKRKTGIMVSYPINPEVINKGHWSLMLRGKYLEDRFILSGIEASRKPDPCKNDIQGLPRVLIIGDSISMNYHKAAKKALQGKVNYHRIEGNGGPSTRGIALIDHWVGPYWMKGRQWDIIQLNHGLHDLKQQPYRSKVGDPWGDFLVPIEDYKKNLEREIAQLKKTGAKIIWCSTTPVPEGSTRVRWPGKEAVFNKAALEVMKKHPEIIINDLNKVVQDSDVFEKWRKGNNVHFRDKEQEVLGLAVAETILQTLK